MKTTTYSQAAPKIHALEGGPGNTPYVIGKQIAIYGAMSVCLVVCTMLIATDAAEYFRKYLGPVNPVPASITAAVICGSCLLLLRRSCGIQIISGVSTRRGIMRAAIAAAILGIAITIADLFIRYPEDINVPVPAALLFYPAIGLIAETVFHVLPFTVLVSALLPLRSRIGERMIIIISGILVATAEPTFQVSFEGKPITPGAIYTWVHIFAIACTQLFLLWKYEFASMFAFRMYYYAYWHILWGALRLAVFFG